MFNFKLKISIQRLLLFSILINSFQLIKTNSPTRIVFTDIQSKSYDNVFTNVSVGINNKDSSFYGRGTVNEVISNEPDNEITVFVKLFILIKKEWKPYGYENKFDMCSIAKFLDTNFKKEVNTFNEVYVGSKGIHNCPYQENEIYHLENLVVQDLIPSRFLMFIQKGEYKINVWCYKTISLDDVVKFRLYFTGF